ncbi:CBF/Mak21 family-domain-containing protein [Lasiosphaeria miniovina]|uniref:CBF/Mak21 family-domain-containing protein n=1 Tax=Lasiosphaeria miniovina TaxID=1954250 RepID=A0AA39ZUE5_9PEZI|nr:CBF/Mak21 family-domain-containing protein [Lasiosphaeria miniovina]KAK0703843.1 CBF/Mak21 family-domain-containing protein [Lasiosphaeria miniovina]
MGLLNRAEKRKAAEASGFDETALAQLTSEIDKSLSQAEAPATKRKKQRNANDGAVLKTREAGPAVANFQNGPDGQKSKHSSNSKSSALLAEILVLGGDQDDFDLVANIDSSDEDGQNLKPEALRNAPVDKAFRDELAEFALSLGIGNAPQDDDIDSDASEDSFEAAGEEDEEQEQEAEKARRDASPPLKETRGAKHLGKLIFKPRPDWHGVNVEELPSNAPDNTKPYSSSIVNLKTYAEKLLDEDSANYSAMKSSLSTQRFMSTIMLSGTLSDKVSALTLAIQESPLHNRKAFESLVNLAGKKSRGQAIAALGALVDLLGNGAVLPGDRRLCPFNAEPALLGSLDGRGSSPWMHGQKLPGKLTMPHLMMWAYEDWLKGAYFRIIQLLEIWCSDEIEYSRSRALDFIYGLLKDKPEQEANLLRLLVNKLSDRERKIASRASYLLLQLLNVHPGMKGIVISSIEQEVLLKPGQSLRTRYYAINTLNQTILSSKEPAVADTLLRIYFEIFLSLLKSGSLGGLDVQDNIKNSSAKKSDGDRKNKKRKVHGAADAPTNEQETAQKLVSSLLTGVNRAVPFTDADDSTLEKHLDTLFRITHSSNFNTSVQALILIQQLAASKHLAVERFYRTLYESLLDPRLVTSSKQALYLNLLFRSLKNDVDVRRVKAFVKRLLQVLNLHQPSFACGILFLIAELELTFPNLYALLTVPEDNGDDSEEVYRDVTENQSLHDVTSQEVAATTSSRRIAGYDGRKRDPEHSNANRSCLWEIIPFLSHFHPSVCVFAANLLAQQKTLPKPELANHTLMHFLDKFVYRSPKAADTKRSGSIMQPVLGSGGPAHAGNLSSANARKVPIVNSASFWNLKPEQVSAEDAFFHEYFARVGKPQEEARAKKRETDGAESDEGSEQEIWEALVNSRPDVEGGDGDDDSEPDMGGYDSDSDLDLDDSGDEMVGVGEESPNGHMSFEGVFDDSQDDEPESEEDDAEVAEPKGKNDEGRRRRKEMKALPTFASADDFAEMLAAEDSGLDDQ